MSDGGKHAQTFWDRSRDTRSASLLLPNVEGLSPNRAIRACGHQVSARMEVAMDKRVRRKETLSLFRRFESLHLSFSTSCRTMRGLGPAVQISALSMFDLRRELAVCRAVASWFVDHAHALPAPGRVGSPWGSPKAPSFDFISTMAVIPHRGD